MKRPTPFVKEFLKTALRTLQETCPVEVEAGKPFVKGKKDQPVFEVVGVLNPSDRRFPEQIRLCFPMPIYLEMVAHLLGDRPSALSEDLRAGAAELLDIMWKRTRASMDETFRSAECSKVLERAEMSRRPGSAIVVPFHTKAGDVQIEFELESE